MKPTDDKEEMDEADGPDEKIEDRTRDYSKFKYVQEQLSDLYAAVERGFTDKKDQSRTIDECWDIYNCELNENQTYYGSSKVYIPIVRDAITARETRFTNMLFPQTNRYADVITNDGREPYELIGLLDYYVRRAKLREKIVPAMIRTGDCAGAYALYVDWIEQTRHVAAKVKVAEVETELGTPVGGSPEFDDIEYQEVKECYPDVMVLDPRDLCVLPATVNDIEDAEVVAVILRFTEKKIKKWIRDKIFDESAGKQLLANMSATSAKQLPDTGKKAAKAAGVTVDSKGNKVALVYQVWSKLKIRGETRNMVTHFGDAQLVLGCKRNPYWCDRVPVIMQTVEKMPGSIWGPIPVDKVKSLQYQANDVANEGFDSAQYALLPIVLTDPEKNPQAGSMVLAMASVWLADPNSTKFAEFPALWKDALQLVSVCKDQIFQSLGVNPAMIPHGNAAKKPTQAQIAQEQQVALESAADNVALIQEGVLSQLLEWFYELDYQYRTEAVTVKQFGQYGLHATMEQVEPFQVRERLQFRWYGTEGFKAIQQVQQMISWANVLKGIPPQLLNGRKVDFGPAAEYISEVTFGPRLAPHVLIDERHQLTMSPDMENQLIMNHFPVQVHPMDNDMEHIQAHTAAFQQLFMLPPQVQEMDQSAVLARGHILEHIKQAKAKAAAAQGAQPGMIGSPGAPRPGATAQMPTGPQQPAGAVRPDNMPLAMPRKA